MNKAQGYFRAEARDFNLYARSILKWDLQYQSFTNTVTQQYYSNVIYESGHKLGSLWLKKGPLLIRYRMNKSSKPLWKINKLTFTNISWLILEATLKSKQPFTHILSLQPTFLTFSLLHIPNASGHCLLI